MNVAGIAIGLMVGAGFVLPQWHQAFAQQALAQADTAAQACVIVVKATTAWLTLRDTAAGQVMKSSARIREMASPQAEPLFQIVVDNEIELEAQIPSIHIAKLKTGEIARVTVAGGAERVGKVRLVAPDIDERSQRGKVGLAVGYD